MPKPLEDYPLPITAGAPFVLPVGIEDINPFGWPEGSFGALGLAGNIKDGADFYNGVTGVPEAIGGDLSRAMNPCANN